MPVMGTLLDNINRWRRQISLPPFSQDQLNGAVERLNIGGTTADFVELTGERETILGVVATAGDQAWYFKLKGDSDLAQKEKQRFREFATTFDFP
jgi:hypothetical protein